MERTDELRAKRLTHPEKAYVASMPKTVCTFTGMRRLYLRPEARRRDHPHAFTHPEQPILNYTEVVPTAGKSVYLP